MMIEPKYSLYPHQRQVLADIMDALSTRERRAVAHLPTGAGKTRIASCAACSFLNRDDRPDALVIWLASTEELCEQAADELENAWAHLGLREACVHRYWGGYFLDLRKLASGFLVAGLAKLRSSALQDIVLLSHLASRISIAIFDEAHQAVAQTYSFVTEQLCSTRSPLLGLTATPGRTLDIGDADYRLASMFDHKKISIDPKGHGNPVTYLIKDRYLADPTFIPITFKSSTFVADPSSGSDYEISDLERLGDNDKRTNLIIDLVESVVSRHSRIIVFCPSVRSAMECDKRCQDKAITSYVVTAHTSSEDRRSIIKNFKSDTRKHMVMFNYGVLTAGFDAPRTRCVIIARPTTSLVLYSQMVGRALRGPKAGGNSRAEVFTVADTNLPGFGSVTSAFENWEELWST